MKKELENAEGGHDWFHIERVWKLSKEIAKSEDVNLMVVELGALLHDIADAKFHNGDESIGPRKAKEFLEKMNIEKSIILHVINIVENISFKNTLEDHEKKKKSNSKELSVVQDADRLDAIGAIGVARAFNYGGYKNRPIHDPSIPLQEYANSKAYHKSDAPTINHFYEKLFKLKDLAAHRGLLDPVGHLAHRLGDPLVLCHEVKKLEMMHVHDDECSIIID